MISYDSDKDERAPRPPSPPPPSISSFYSCKSDDKDDNDNDFEEHSAPRTLEEDDSMEKWWKKRKAVAPFRQRLTWNRRRMLYSVVLTLLAAIVVSLVVAFSVRRRNTNAGSQQQSTVVNVTADADETTVLSPALPPSLLTWTVSPSQVPSDVPSQVPSTVPTSTPTVPPTPAFYPSYPVPSNPPPGYFNYDPSSEYGPPKWHLVDTSHTWLREFGWDGWGAWQGHIDYPETPLTHNLCAAKGKQSPKHLGLNLMGSSSSNAECVATHEIRSRCGQDALWNDDAYTKQILPHTLRIKATGRPCLDVESNGMGIDECKTNQPPMVDYPNYSSQGTAYADMHHLDIKVPGEHTIHAGGETFDAEIQMFHVHLEDGRLSSIGIPIRATSNTTTTNEEFQWILDEFQYVYDMNAATCGITTSTHLRGNSSATASIARQSPASSTNKFNPYNLMQSMWFYRYDGSITEPPCRDITWWVMMDPLEISLLQLHQLQTLLFTNVNPETCQPTSVHYNMSSSRPIQPLGEGKTIQECGAGSFRSDVDKGRPAANECRED